MPDGPGVVNNAQVLIQHIIRVHTIPKTFLMSIKNIICLTLLLSAQFNGGSAQTKFWEPCSTEEQCEARYTTMNNAGVIRGYFYSSVEFPTKGCVLKEDNIFFGTGGTAEEMAETDLPGKQVRVWCEAMSSSPAAGESGMSMSMSLSMGLEQLEMSMSLPMSVSVRPFPYLFFNCTESNISYHRVSHLLSLNVVRTISVKGSCDRGKSCTE